MIGFDHDINQKLLILADFRGSCKPRCKPEIYL